jgi:hypothetical protein
LLDINRALNIALNSLLQTTWLQRLVAQRSPWRRTNAEAKHRLKPRECYKTLSQEERLGDWGGGQFKRWLKQEKGSEEVREKKYSRQTSKRDPNVHT